MGFVNRIRIYTHLLELRLRVFRSLPQFVSLGYVYTIALHFQYNTNSVPKSWKFDAVCSGQSVFREDRWAHEPVLHVFAPFYQQLQTVASVHEWLNEPYLMNKKLF